MNVNYRRGRNYEYSIKSRLESDGFIALRTAGSHGVVDCVGIGKDCIRFIQAKRHQETLKGYPLEVARRAGEMDAIDKLSALEVPDNCTKELWLKHGRKELKILVL